MRGMDESEENGLPFGAMEPQLKKKPGQGDASAVDQYATSMFMCNFGRFFFFFFFLQYRLNANEWMEGQTLL